MRVVGLLPAATEIVCALGLRESLVGRSHECDFPRDVAELPALTRARVDSGLPSGALDAEVRRVFEARLPLYDLDEERLAGLRPDVIITQEACEVCAVSYGQVLRSLERARLRARVVALRPTRLADLLANVREVARACGAPTAGERVAAALQARLRLLRRWRPGLRPRVAVVEWLDPPMLAGHWTPELLGAAGAEPLGPSPGAASTYASWEQIRALRPDALVVAPCGFDLERTIAEAAPLAGRLREITSRVLLMDGNAYVNRPGPRLVDAAETVAAWLRGDLPPAQRARAL